MLFILSVSGSMTELMSNNNGLRRVLRFAVLGSAIIAVFAAAVVLAVQFSIHLANEWQQYALLPSMPPPRAEDRILVFAPHSDDETLGCGGLLALASRQGARLRVVLITNGDGYRVGVARAFGTIKITPEMCIRYAHQRQEETYAALEVLRVPRRNVIFLGYPDRGIAALWHKNWAPDELYTSRATQMSHSPYPNAFRPNAPYCGESLLADIERIILQEKPTDIYLPHPCDNHPDHWATYCFVTAALEQPSIIHLPIKLHTYLVHRGDWPTPKGDHPNQPLAPPHALANGDTRWESLSLPTEIAAMKRTAIKKYKTQTAIERGFLMSFARTNEIFGDLPVRKVMSVADNAITVDGNSEDWQGILPAVVDAVGDYIVAGLTKGGDVRAIYACADKRNLYVRIDCVRKLSKRLRYNIDFRSIEGSKANYYSVVIGPSFKCNTAEIPVAYKGKTIELAVPLTKFETYGNLYIRVETKLVKLIVDDTGWHDLEFASSLSL